MSRLLFSPYTPPTRGDLPSRLVAAGLSTLILFVLAMVLLRMGILENSGAASGSHLTAVSLSAANRPEAHKAAAKSAAQAHPIPQPQPRQPDPVPPKVPPLALIPLSHAEFAAADISKLPSHRNDNADNNASGSAAATYGPGDGPGGAHLFNAEWYHEPPRAALASYLPTGAPPGSWAMIACRTVEHYHVEDCQELDESPPGSGLSRALRQAAWQFLVRPPRINGQPLIGAWVRIRFDFTRKGEKSDD